MIKNTITLVVLFTLIMYILPSAAAQREGITLFNKKILFDDEKGNESGWNPDGNETTFTIYDSKVDRWNSTILINLKESMNYTVCNVDFISNGDFDVTCTTPPGERSRLHYMVINSEPIDESGLSLSKVIKNITDVERERLAK